jgi:hypothetical protein
MVLETGVQARWMKCPACGAINAIDQRCVHGLTLSTTNRSQLPRDNVSQRQGGHAMTPRYCLQKKMLDQGAHAVVICAYDEAIELH